MRHTSEPSYISFREKFLKLSEKLQLKNYRHIIPGVGWHNEELSQDFAYLDQGSDKTLVHISGIHGIEGYLGSLIQEKILSSFDSGFQDSKVNLIFLHALNPFGMSWYRRVNGNNIDLNRNGLASFPPPANPHFFEFKELLQSSALVELCKKLPSALARIQKLGFREGAQSIAGGQWQFPDCIFFGGHNVQPEIAHLPQTLLTLAPQTKKFCFIDVHTGLGPQGYDSLLVADSENLSFFRQATEENHVVDTGPSSRGNLYQSQNTVESWLRKNLPNHEISYVTQEFGTCFVGQVLLSLIFENSLYVQDPKSKKRPDLLLKTFYPDKESWRKLCRKRGLQRFSQILQAF